VTYGQCAPPAYLVTPRLVSALGAAAVLAFACGPRPPAKETQSRRSDAAADSLTSKLAVALSRGVQLSFQVTNASRRSVELNFPSGHTHDFFVLDAAGREVWRWSEGRLFTQAMQNRVLGRDESLTYQAGWQPGANQGTFVAVVSLMSENHPLEQRVQFTVP
jgi:hypothetical protein